MSGHSALFDYIAHGGDDKARLEAALEHALGALGREVDLHAETRALNAHMLAALKASEAEYENLEARAPLDSGCIECTAGTVPNRLNTGPCAHHLRRAAIAKVEGQS